MAFRCIHNRNIKGGFARQRRVVVGIVSWFLSHSRFTSYSSERDVPTIAGYNLITYHITYENILLISIKENIT